jgi:benzylsuccinate CoA-transferase BbsF subunit
MTRQALEGVKVADFCWALAGPLSTKVLADHGAEVIKIEGGNQRIDNQRVTMPFKDDIFGVDRAAVFNPHNTSKRSVAMNLAHPKGVELAKKLVAWADIVTENFAGGAMDRMGLGYEELQKVNPNIIMLSTSVQGQTGPHAGLSGFGPHLAAMSGLQHITGWPDRPATDIEVYTDFITSRFVVPSLIAALLYRRRTGKGQYIDASQYEMALQFMTPLILDKIVNNRVAGRMGNRHPDAAPHAAYRCRGEDRWCAISVFTDEEWTGFCEVIANPAWTRDSKFQTLAGRQANEDELNSFVETWTNEHTAEEVMERMQAAGVAAGVLKTIEDLMEYDPQLAHRHHYWKLDHPEIGEYVAWGPPYKLSKSPAELRSAPLLGEHNEFAMKDILGMTDEEVVELIIDEVLE